jgi:exodeoxyribonuclease-1
MNFLWYDLETFGRDPRLDRIAQFGAIRTDENLEPLEEPTVLYCAIPRDYLPDPQAVLKTGITPQETRRKGVREIDFARELNRMFREPGTCGVGFNSVSFDDEFLRSLFYRNFIDPYEREYRNGNSRWDILSLARMARDLRPAGLRWPDKPNGKPDMRLEALTAANGISHEDAHDALSDVRATMELARLIREAQPKLFDFFLRLRDKREARLLVDLAGQTPIVHTDVRYTRPEGVTTLVAPLAMDLENNQAVLVYDLRFDPTPFLTRGAEELRRNAFTPRSEQPDEEQLPVTRLALNRVPSIAPRSTMDQESSERLGINLEEAERHREILRRNPEFARRVQSAFAPVATAQQRDPEEELYAGFLPDADRNLFPEIHRLPPRELIDWEPPFRDPRLPVLLHRVKMRNFEEHLTPEERRRWYEEAARRLLLPPSQKLMDLERYELRVSRLMEEPGESEEEKKIARELWNYSQAVRATLPVGG